MDAFEIEVAVNSYEAALQKLEESQSSPTEEECLHLLIARDEVQKLLLTQSRSAKEYTAKIYALDERLREQSELLAKSVPINEWKELLEPPLSNWWWTVKPKELIHPLDRLDWLWELLTIPILGFNFALVVAVSSRFLAGGPDAIGAFAVLGQSAVAMLAAGAPLTKKGHQALENILTFFRLPKYLWHEAKLALAVVVFMGLLGFQNLLPKISSFYVLLGTDAQNNRQVTRALTHFQRAIDLDPNNMQARFRLGTLYQDLTEIEKARNEYQIALSGGCVEAFNNQARLLIVHDQDYFMSLNLLRRGQMQLHNRDRSTIKFCSQAAQSNFSALEYSFSTNIGWALFMRGRYAEAEAYLRAAIDIYEAGAAPHCLLAQVLEQRSTRESIESLEEWQKCDDFASNLNPDEDQWLDMARKRLSVPSEPQS